MNSVPSNPVHPIDAQTSGVDTSVTAKLRRAVSPVVKVALLGIAMLAGTAALIGREVGQLDAIMPSPWWVPVAFAIGVVLAEQFVFHIEYRRNAFTFSISEVPIALALVFLNPLVAIAIRVVVSLTTIRLRWKSPAYKLFFNGALFAFELAIAQTVVWWIGGHAATGAPLVLAVVAALVAGTFVSSLAVAAAIAFFEHDLLARLIDEAKAFVALTPAVAATGAVTLAPALYDPRLMLLGVVPVGAVWMLVRQHGGLTQRHRDLQHLHTFAVKIGRSLDSHLIAQAAVDGASELMRAEIVNLVLFDQRGAVLSVATTGEAIPDLPGHLDDPNWYSVFAAGRACAISTEAGRRTVVEGNGDTIAVPVADDSGVAGLLVLAHRSGAFDHFVATDLERADTLASQLVAALRKAFLHASVEHAASHDVLTGNLNRAAFEQAIIDVDLEAHACQTVFMLDLNRFKEINDTLGHHIGDRVLVEFARRLHMTLRPTDVAARFGGDEFAVLVHRDSLDEVLAVANRIDEAAFVPMSLDGLNVIVTASIGVAVIEPEHRDPAEVLRRADVAMYAAKRSPIAVEVYRNEIDRRTPKRLSMLGNVHDALEANAIEIHFQPKVDLVTNTVVAAEALIRWDRPDYGPVDPLELIRVAEESGIIKQITDYVLRGSIAMARRWHDDGFDLGVAVNLSAHDLLDDQLPQRIERLLAIHSVPAERLTLEITETALLSDTPRTVSTIDRLSRMGLRLSLDDFGTGYSSLGYLRRLPVTELKVDRSFVKNLLLDEQDAVIVRSTIDLGHNLGLQVVAEGVENGPTLDRLRELGCDIGQGYGISRALPPKMFDTWLRTTKFQVSAARHSGVWA